MGNTQENQLNERRHLLFNYTCETTHARLNKSSDNNRKMNTIFLSSSELYVNNTSNNRIQQQSNSLTIHDNNILESTISNEEKIEDDQGHQDVQLPLAQNDTNGHICVYDLLSGFPDVSYCGLFESLLYLCFYDVLENFTAVTLYQTT